MKLPGAVFLCIAMAVVPAWAAGEPDWNGTWIGYWKKQPAQLVFANNTFISMFWDGDYTDANGTVSPDAKTVTVIWSGGNAVVTWDGQDAAHIAINEIGKQNISFPLKREK